MPKRAQKPWGLREWALVVAVGLVTALPVSLRPAHSATLLAPPLVSGQPQLTYSPWTKYCTPVSSGSAPGLCYTGETGRIASGEPVLTAVLIDLGGQASPILRVTLPLGMRVPEGARIIVDQSQPLNGAYTACIPEGCVVDDEASGELVDQLKRGQNLIVQGINGRGETISLGMPLSGFAKAYDGPPNDPNTRANPADDYLTHGGGPAAKNSEIRTSRRPALRDK